MSDRRTLVEEHSYPLKSGIALLLSSRCKPAKLKMSDLTQVIEIGLFIDYAVILLFERWWANQRVIKRIKLYIFK